MAADRIMLTKVTRTCLYAPIQWDAWDEHGNYYYLRHRHERGRIEGEHASVHFGPEELDADTDEQLLAAFLDQANAAADGCSWHLAPGAELIPYDDTQDLLDEESERAPMAIDIPPAPAAPVPLLEGTFAIYQPPDGSLLLSWRKKGSPESHPMPIPRHIMMMAANMSGLSQEEMLAKISAGVV